MAENFYTILTKIGLAKFANAQITQTNVNLSFLAVGDGNGNYYDPDSSITALVNEQWRGGIGAVEIDADNPNWIVIEGVIPATAGGFTIREVGLIDADGDLIAIGKYPETYKPVLEEGSSKDLYIRMIIESANAGVVTLKVDPAVVIASRKYVDDKVSQIDLSKVDELETIFNEHKADDASLTKKGHVQLQTTVDAAENRALTPKALRDHSIEDSSTTKKGHVQLSSATDSEDESLAATPKAVKLAMDNAANRALIAKGTYTGNNSATRTIAVGFTPQFLYISALGQEASIIAQVSFSGYDENALSLGDFSTADNVLSVRGKASNHAPVITANGFTVGYFSGGKAGLNYSGTSYGWVAIG